MFWLATQLHKTVAEIEAMDSDEFVGWVAYFELNLPENPNARHAELMWAITAPYKKSKPNDWLWKPKRSRRRQQSYDSILTQLKMATNGF